MAELVNSISSYTWAELISALHSSERHIRFRYELLDKNLARKRWMDTVLTCEISYSEERGVKRMATIEVVDDGRIIWGSDRIRPWVYLRMPDGKFAGWAQGTFMLPFTSRNMTEGGNFIRQVTCPDHTHVLVDDRVSRRYQLNVGVSYTAAVESLLVGAGFSNANIEHSSEALPWVVEWDLGTPRLEIINSLLEEINYRPISFDAVGRAEVKRYIEPADRPVRHTYDFGTDSVTEPRITREDSLGDTPNKWVAVVSDQNLEITSVYVNDDATSPTSTVTLGRVITAFFSGARAVNQAALDGLVRRRAIQDSQRRQTISFTTAIMPFHGINEALYLDFGDELTAGKFEEVGWSFPLSADGKMEHQARRVFEA